jgi:hypothetical protein
MLTIEFEAPKSLLCPCCGHTTLKLLRYVRNDEGAYAVYLARLSAGHPELGITGLVSLGEWGGGDPSPANRVAFGFRLSAADRQPQVQIVDLAETPWAGEAFFGQALTRAQALEHPKLQEVFQLTDQIVAEDEPVRRFLQG